MSRLFTLLCLAMFTLAAPACDEEDSKDPSTTDEASSGEDSTGDAVDSTSDSGDLAAGDTSGHSDTSENPGTATLATPHISTGETL